MPKLRKAVQQTIYIHKIMQIPRFEVIAHHLHQSQQLCDLSLGLLLGVSLPLDEPLIEMIAELEEQDNSDEQKDEEVVQDKLRVILQWLEAIQTQIREVGDDEQYIRQILKPIHTKYYKQHPSFSAFPPSNHFHHNRYSQHPQRLICTNLYKTMNKYAQNEKSDKMIKILLIGNSGVGKSSILLQYSDKKFAHSYYNTIGVDYRIKYININETNIKLQIWDTAGQDRFKTITSSYYRGADGIIIVYDITDKTSFDNVKTWLAEIEKYVDERTVKFIVGNKNDLEEKRQVSQKQAQVFTQELGTPFRETSARLATNIDDLFLQITEKILSNNANLAASQSTSKALEPQQAGELKRGGQNIKKLMQQKKDEQKNCCSIY